MLSNYYSNTRPPNPPSETMQLLNLKLFTLLAPQHLVQHAFKHQHPSRLSSTSPSRHLVLGPANFCLCLSVGHSDFLSTPCTSTKPYLVSHLLRCSPRRADYTSPPWNLYVGLYPWRVKPGNKNALHPGTLVVGIRLRPQPRKLKQRRIKIR